MVYLEAMAFKLPIVALIGALPDFVEEGKNGFLLDYKNIKGLASKIIYLLDNPELCQEMGEFGYQKVKQQYQWEKSVASIREFIEKQGGWVIKVFKITVFLPPILIIYLSKKFTNFLPKVK
jgi:glycosyltransferase involved in cell wall biosynthesis